MTSNRSKPRGELPNQPVLVTATSFIAFNEVM